MRAPLSLPQRSILEADHFRPGLISERVTLWLALRIHGRLDLKRLDQAFDLLVHRHEILRTLLVPASADRRGIAHAEVLHHAPVSMAVEDAGYSEAELFARWDEVTVDPRRPPLARCFVARRDSDEHLVALVFSHIVADPTSLRVAFRDLAAVYNALCAGEPLPPPPPQYSEYAAWQAPRLRERLEGDRASWKQALAGLKPPRYRRSFHFVPGQATAPIETTLPVFSKAEIDALSAWSWRHRSTLSTTLLAAFARALREDAKSDDLVVSTLFEQRAHPAARQMFGIFLYATVIRLRVDADAAMPELVEHTRNAVLDAYRRTQIPLVDYMLLMPRFIPGALGLEPTWFRFFQYVPMERAEYRFGEATATIAQVGGRVDPRDLVGLHLGVFHARDGGLHGKFSYDTKDLDEAGARRVLADFRDFALELVA